MAPNKKKRIPDMSPKCDSKAELTPDLSEVKRMYKTQHSTPVIIAVAVLLIFILFSNIIAA
jgi:hypothetical protein